MTTIPDQIPGGPVADDAGVLAPRSAMVFSFFAALIPRLWALDWGLPLKRGHIDEAVVVFYSLRAVSGDPNPRIFFDYPAFFLYALAALFKGALVVARLWGQAVPPDTEAWSAYMKGDGLLFLLVAARGLNAFLGALTAVVLCRFGAARRGLFVGMAAALLWAVNPLAVLHAHYATVDTAAVLFTLLSVERLSAYWDDGRLIDGLWAAFLIGLAAATKYYPAALMGFLLPAAVLRAERPWRTAGLLASVSGATFLAASPYTVLEAASFARRFAYLFSKIVGAGGSDSLRVVPTLQALFSNAGGPACFVAAAGLVLFLRSPSRGEKLIAAVFLSLLLFFGLWNAQLAHYALPLYPLLFLAVGRALSETRRWQRALPVGGLAILMAVSIPRTVSCLERLSTPDTRLTALAWVRDMVPPGSRILRFAHTPEFSTRDPFQVTVDWENQRLEKGVPALSVDGFDFVLYASYGDQDAIADAMSARFHLLHRFNDPPPAFPHDPVVYIYRVAVKK